MPGVIMENGTKNGAHTNHDRDQRPNGVNGSIRTAEKYLEKGKGREEPQQNMTPTSPTTQVGSNGAFGIEAEPDAPNFNEQGDRLPDEITHVTEGYIPLNLLLTRMAEKGKKDIEKIIEILNGIPLPASVVNGNGSWVTSGEDNSEENIQKKLQIMKFAEDSHADFTKALVITGWSQRHQDIKKLIDLRIHLFKLQQAYSGAYESLGLIRKDFYHFAVPNPDLKTAVEVLSTGRVSGMPELGYIPLTPFTPKETLKHLETLNTLLSIRLNIHDYDSIPPQFKDYTIQSGRVTFQVPGEFEVDLGLATEDPQEQLWCIDFRFMFSPAPSTLAPGHRVAIYNQINTALKDTGLTGCYKKLHEMVLTHKISEFVRQATKLASLTWIDTLKVERLNRAMSIQYWADRYPKEQKGYKGPKIKKSWIILGVHSGKRKETAFPDPKATSRLFLRWFRDGTEIKDVDIPFDDANISTESLLKLVIAQHVRHILTSIYEKLREASLYMNRELALTLSISPTEPAESEIKIQLTNELHLSVKIEPITGRFIFSPGSLTVNKFALNLNTRSLDPANDGNKCLEQLRCALIAENITSRGLTARWIRTSGPGLNINADALQAHLPKDKLDIIWLRRPEWLPDWHLAVIVTRSGELWKLMKTVRAPTLGSVNQNAIKVEKCIPIKIPVACPSHDYTFLSKIKVFTTGLLVHHATIKDLDYKKATFVLRPGKSRKQITLPDILVRLSTLIPSHNKSPRTGLPWAKDVIQMTYRGLGAVSGSEHAVTITEVRLIMPTPQTLSTLSERVDQDIRYNIEFGFLSIRLLTKVGKSVISQLIERVTQVERFVEFVQVLEKHRATSQCETASLGKIIFTYGNPIDQVADNANSKKIGNGPYRAVVDFSRVEEGGMKLQLESGNPHLEIADHLNKVLNSKEGLDGVATLLTLTLPLVRAFDFINEKGEAFINTRAADWYVIRYVLPSPQEPTSLSKARTITFEIRLSHRRGEPWWAIRRCRNDHNKESSDEFDEALKSVWASSGEGWMGMEDCALARPRGAENALRRVDEVVRACPVGEKKVLPELTANQSLVSMFGRQQARAPVPPQQIQRSMQQQPTPSHSQSQSQNHSQGQSQGRMKQQREVVEID